MEDKKKISQIKVVFSKTSKIRIHDRKTFNNDPEKENALLKKLQNSHEQRDATKPKLILQKRTLKPVTNCYDESAIKDIVNTMDDELLALIVLTADSAKVANGLMQLAKGSIKKK